MVVSRRGSAAVRGRGVRRRALSLTLALLVPVPVLAADATEAREVGVTLAGPPAPQVLSPRVARNVRPRTASLRGDAALVSAGQLADIASTEYALSRPHLREGNPLMANRAVRIPVKLGIAVGLSAACQQLRKHEKHGKARALALLAFGVGAAATIHNVRAARQ